MSASMINQGNLLPLVQKAEAEVYNFWSLNGTGLNGMFVALETGNQDPANGDGFIAGSSIGASYTNITSPRYEVKRKVRPVGSGDSKFNTLGVTLMTVSEYDENGNKLILQPKDARDERGFLLSGEAVPVLARGMVRLKSSQYVGTPIPGYVGVPYTGGGGKIQVVNPATLPNTGNGLTVNNVIGKFVSTSGSAFGGYADFKIEL